MTIMRNVSHISFKVKEKNYKRKKFYEDPLQKNEKRNTKETITKRRLWFSDYDSDLVSNFQWLFITFFTNNSS